MSITSMPYPTHMRILGLQFSPAGHCLLTEVPCGPRVSLILFCLLSGTDCSQKPGPGVQPPVSLPLQLLPV